MTRTFDLGHALVAVKLLSLKAVQKFGAEVRIVSFVDRRVFTVQIGFCLFVGASGWLCFSTAAMSYTRDLMSRNNTLPIDARLDRRKNFQQQFSFTDAEVTLKPGLKTFMSATEDNDRFFFLTGTVHVSVMHFPGLGQENLPKSQLI